MNLRPCGLERVINDYRHPVALPDLPDEEGQPGEPQQGEDRRSSGSSQRRHEYAVEAMAYRFGVGSSLTSTAPAMPGT